MHVNKYEIEKMLQKLKDTFVCAVGQSCIFNQML